MNATPPYEPATWVTFSAREARVARAQPAASPTSAKLMKTIADRADHLQERIDPEEVVGGDRERLGQHQHRHEPVQNFDQRKSRIETGAVRMIQNAGPSADTAGKTKRTATADMHEAGHGRG